MSFSSHHNSEKRYKYQLRSRPINPDKLMKIIVLNQDINQINCFTPTTDLLPTGMEADEENVTHF